MIVYTHKDCLKKFNGNKHPERKERLDSIINSMQSLPELSVIFKEAPLATMSEISLVHPKDHIEAIFNKLLTLSSLESREDLLSVSSFIKASLSLL